MGCTLLSDTFGALVQLALLVVGVAILLLKRHIESPRRTWKIWSLDISKQGASGLCAHLAGMVNSMFLVSMTSKGDECSWYLIAFTLDTSIGVTIAYFAIQNLHKYALRCGWSSLQASGEYGEPPDLRVWGKQLAVWCIITVAARGCVLLLMMSLRSPLSWFAAGIAEPFEGHPQLFLVLVMLAAPVGMNLLQLWIQDNFLKKKKDLGCAYDDMPEEVALKRMSQDMSHMI